MTVELGAFARIFTRPRAEEVAAAVAATGIGVVQLNLSCVGLPTVPPAGTDLDLAKVRSAFDREGVRIWGVSATYNLIDPDVTRRDATTAGAIDMIRQVPASGAAVVTLCTGSRDPSNMWRRHPDNDTAEAWRDMRATLDRLLPVAQAAGVRLGIEPEPANVIADAGRARRLITELRADAALIGIVLDAANLVTPETIERQGDILEDAFATLGPHIVALHAKDVVEDGAYAAAGVGALDYRLIFRLHAQLPAPVPVIIQDAEEHDVPRVLDFLFERAAQV